MLFDGTAEMEADMFAAIVCEQRPMPTGRRRLKEPCLTKIMEYIGGEWSTSGLKHLVPQPPSTCWGRCAGAAESEA